jgi:hypothetical protein
MCIVTMNRAVTLGAFGGVGTREIASIVNRVDAVVSE